MPTDRLDAIVLGADIEGLFAAVALASAGRHVCVLEAPDTSASVLAAQDCFVSLAAVEELDLVSHGLRLGAAPPVAGINHEQSLVIWPDIGAAQASIAAVSQRDADAYEGFCARVIRAANYADQNGDASLCNWHLSANGGGDPATENIFLRGTSVARLLEEEFSSTLLRGMLAQGALIGTGVSLRAPGSANLLTRQSMLSLFGDDRSLRYVSGGAAGLRQALLTCLKFFNTADVHSTQSVKKLIFEKPGVAGVTMADGTTVRAPTVISTLGLNQTLELTCGVVSSTEEKAGFARPGLVHFRTRSFPGIRSLGGALVASGAIVRLNPSLERLGRGYGAFRARNLIQDYCLELKILPCREPVSPARWDVYASVLYVPALTDEGPWSGNRRERFVAAVAKSIEVWAPGFEPSIESSVLAYPTEAPSFVDAESPMPLARQKRQDPWTAPDLRYSGVEKLHSGLWSIEQSLTLGAGLAGLKVAKACVPGTRGRSSLDA